MASFITTGHLPELFEGAKLNVTKMRAVLPNGVELDEKRFNVVFGGYVFALDNASEKTTRRAWVAFTENMDYRPEFVW